VAHLVHAASRDTRTQGGDPMTEERNPEPAEPAEGGGPSGGAAGEDRDPGQLGDGADRLPSHGNRDEPGRDAAEQQRDTRQ
jgi:hypothetical protein